MGYQAWNLFTDWDYLRETLAWQEAEDALEAEQIEDERREKERYTSVSERHPLLGGERK